jgi:hypothetical protein
MRMLSLAFGLMTIAIYVVTNMLHLRKFEVMSCKLTYLYLSTESEFSTKRNKTKHSNNTNRHAGLDI